MGGPSHFGPVPAAQMVQGGRIPPTLLSSKPIILGLYPLLNIQSLRHFFYVLPSSVWSIIPSPASSLPQAVPHLQRKWMQDKKNVFNCPLVVDGSFCLGSMKDLPQNLSAAQGILLLWGPQTVEKQKIDSQNASAAQGVLVFWACCELCHNYAPKLTTIRRTGRLRRRHGS